MKVTFDEIYYCFKFAFATLLNATYLVAIQDSVDKAFYNRLFQQYQNNSILALKALFLFSLHQTRT